MQKAASSAQRMAETQHFYQAIGELRATLVVAEDGTKNE
jgi:hypothetical protein